MNRWEIFTTMPSKLEHLPLPLEGRCDFQLVVRTSITYIIYISTMKASVTGWLALYKPNSLLNDKLRDDSRRARGQISPSGSATALSCNC